MDWKVREAKLEDVGRIVQLSRFNADVLMPYTCSSLTTRGYIDQFLVADEVKYQPFASYLGVGGAVHFVPNDDTDIPITDKVVSFLDCIKQVPYDDIICEFMSQPLGRKIAMIGQVICPGKGSFYAILEEAKKQYDEIWCWMSIAGPSFKSYQRYGFNLNMDDERKFWNVYKCDYSTFVLGKWRKEQNV